MANETVLTIDTFGVPPFSARGLTQTLEPIAAAAVMRRDINGNLRNVADPVMRKYKSKISGSDIEPPALDGIMPGALLRVGCVSTLQFPIGGAADRDVVPDSIVEDEETGFAYYRPYIDFVLMNYSIQRDEYEDKVTWSVDLEEA